MFGIVPFEQDIKQLKDVCTQLGIDHKKIDKRLFKSKIYPLDESIKIYSFAYGSKGNPNDTADLYVIVYDTKNKIITVNYCEPEAIVFDTMGPNEIIIDCANYEIKPKSRCFGVRIDYGNKSWIHYGYEEFRLFELNELVMKYKSKESRTERFGGCEYTNEIHSSIFSVDQTHLINEYYPIIEKQEYFKVKSNKECEEEQIKQSFKNILIFDSNKKQYVLQKE